MTIALMGVAAFAQTVTLTFTGRDAADHYVQLNRVSITNLTKGWQENIYWPDTTLTMQNGTGIDESVANGGFVLSQNNPNPFSVITDVNLTVADAGAVTLKIVDGNGKIVETRHGTSLQPGTHQFRVSLSAAGTYVMTARQNGKTSSVKMVCNGGGSTNAIEYLGMVQTITFVLKSTTNNPFNFGDMMEYVGYATINGTEYESIRITQAQGTSQTFVLQFPVEQHQTPTVTTTAASNVTETSATCGGTVTTDGGANVIVRGVCYSTSPAPTTADNHTTDGSGTGSFTSSLTGLTANTTYYVRAYATNSVGTAYGNEVSFTTTIAVQLPTVTTTAASNVTETSATCGGTVTSDGGANVIVRGVCYSTSPAPTTADSHTTDGSGTGGFTSSLTGLTAGTTYYVRAYATNSVGTAYGNEVSFTTTAAAQLPTVTTTAASNVAETSATCGGTVTADGGANVIVRGVCYSTSPVPTTADNHTTDGGGTGSFTSSLTGLTAGTTYYVRAYATNSVGTAYGNEVSFTTTTAAQLPAVTTTTASNVAETSATCGGTVTADGGANVIVRGVCYSTSPAPTTADNHTTDGSGTGIFTSSLTGLTAGTTYYVRAYATNSVGTAYGNEVSFTTTAIPTTQDGQPCPSTPTLTDIDGNTYNTVQIGQQCWMKENLRTTHYANSSAIEQGSSTSTTTPYWYYPNNDANNMSTYGLLYNWVAVMNGASSSNNNPSGVQGLCPTGWHLPSEVEWTQLTDYVSSQNQYMCNSDIDYIAKALASTIGWNSNSNTCAVGNAPDENNATGFSAMPAGGYFVNGINNSFGAYAYFWSTTEHNDSRAYRLRLTSAHAYVSHSDNEKVGGFSIRCLKDNGGSTTYNLPTVTTNAVSNVTETSATCGGTVTADGGANVIVRGVCYSTSPAPTTADNHTTDGSGTGSFTSSLTGLTAGTTYYVRAYATNSVGTAYGNEVSFTTLGETTQHGQPCPGTPTLTDIDGNVYNTVQIGQQCWMKENLRTTRYADNTPISLGDYYVDNTPYRYAPNNDEANVVSYGYLYNWTAAMHNFNSAEPTPFGVQGICPNGWHVPSDAEWVQLTDYVSSQSEYVCGSDNTYIAKALAAATGWYEDEYSDGSECAVANVQSANNATGFSALPAGGIVYSFGSAAAYWSSTANVTPQSASCSGSCYYSFCQFMYDYAVVWASITRRSDALSVRCLRDEGSFSQTLPTVITTRSSLGNSNYEYSFDGVVTSDGGAIVTSRGICWNTTPNPTVSSSHTTDGTGVGIFTNSLSNTFLTPNTTYYVRAYATNSMGTAYGNELSFTTPQGATIILEAGDVWGNGSGYQLLLDADATAYGTIIPECGPLTSSGDADAATYAAFEYKIPQNADGATTTSNIVLNGSATITIPAGYYDFCITNPTPGDRIWIAGTCDYTDYKSGREDRFPFLSGKIYHFYMSLDENYNVDVVTLNSFFNELIHGQTCPGTPTITDIDGNVYNTVQIGNQCWMKESLRTTRYSDSTPIPSGDSLDIYNSHHHNWSQVAPYRYAPNYEEAYVRGYGYLYNWPAVMHNASSSNTNPSGVQGICPTGWHVPSYAEWIQLADYVSSQSEYVCSIEDDECGNGIAVALAATTCWDDVIGGTCSGCYPYAGRTIWSSGGLWYNGRNDTGFSALPAGWTFTGSYQSLGEFVGFWCATAYNEDNAIYRGLYYNYAGLSSQYTEKQVTLSVRCVKN